MKTSYYIALSQATAQSTNTITWKDDWTFDIDSPSDFVAHINVETYEAAQELAARFPKFTRVHAHHLGGDSAYKGTVSFRVALSANGANKGRNETGNHRIKAFLKACREMGIVLERYTLLGNLAPQGPEYYGWE